MQNITHSLLLEVPENIYQPLAQEAKAKGRRIEEIALEKLAKDEKSDDVEFEKLADYFEKNLPADAKPLSD